MISCDLPLLAPSYFQQKGLSRPLAGDDIVMEVRQRWDASSAVSPLRIVPGVVSFYDEICQSLPHFRRLSLTSEEAHRGSARLGGRRWQ